MSDDYVKVRIVTEDTDPDGFTDGELADDLTRIFNRLLRERLEPASREIERMRDGLLRVGAALGLVPASLVDDPEDGTRYMGLDDAYIDMVVDKASDLRDENRHPGSLWRRMRWAEARVKAAEAEAKRLREQVRPWVDAIESLREPEVDGVE